MSIVKVIEVIAEGSTVEKAMESALLEASKTVQAIQQIDIQHVYAKVEHNKITGYRINAKVSFIVKH